MRWALKWGVDHPLFVSKAEGEFPDEDDSCLISMRDVELAQHRDEPEKKTKKRFIGVDPARMGRDETIITTMHDVVVKSYKALQKRRTTAVSGEVINIVNGFTQSEKDQTVITVDATGIGAGVLDELKEYQSGNAEWRLVQIREVHFGETFKEGRDGNERAVAEKTKRYKNKKAEMFVLLSEDVKKELVLPEQSDVYLGELPNVRYWYSSKGQYVIESKEEYKKRTGLGSPDHADSLALANYGRYDTGGTAEFTKEMTQPNRKKTGAEEW
jgi:hypothetical protein